MPIIPATPSELITATRRPTRASRRSRQVVAGVNEQNVVRAADIRGEALVQGERLRSIDRLAREAVGGQALLNGSQKHLAAGDLVLYDDLKFFGDMAKLAKGEVIADFTQSTCDR